jgi:hypothetical protein
VLFAFLALRNGRRRRRRWKPQSVPRRLDEVLDRLVDEADKRRQRRAVACGLGLVMTVLASLAGSPLVDGNAGASPLRLGAFAAAALAAVGAFSYVRHSTRGLRRIRGEMMDALNHTTPDR